MNKDGRPLFSSQELRDLLHRQEGQYLELKSLWDRSGTLPSPVNRRVARDTVAEYVAAFANSDGGILVLGVEDDGTPTGHGYPEDAVDEIILVPSRRLRPAIQYAWQKQMIDGHAVIIFQVSIAPEAVMVEGNGFPYRAGDRVIREPQEVINQRKQTYRRVGYEARVRQEASLDALDIDLAKTFLSRTIYKDRRVEEILELYGLIVPQAGGHAVTNAALLLFGKAPIVRWHPRAGVRFFKVAGKSRLHGARRNVVQKGEGIPRMFEEMEESFLHEPELGVDDGAFYVTLYNEPVLSGCDPEWHKIVLGLPLNAAQKRVLTGRPDGFTNEDYLELNKVDRDQAYKEIQEMVSAGILNQAEARGRGAVYRLAPGLRETKAFPVRAREETACSLRASSRLH